MRRREASDAFTERRRVEDEAPRLRDVVPLLTSCTIQIDERREEQTTPGVTYTRRIMVDHAPALVIVPCGESSCKEGGHDITSELMRGLRAGALEISGEDTCYGSVRTTTCGRILSFKAVATYRADA